MLLLATLPGCAVHAQVTADIRLCDDVVARLPASHDDEQLPLSRRARFELRQCAEGNIQVYGYPRDSATATLKYDTYDDWPLQMVRVQNVLLLISHGGSAEHIYVFEFNAGQPRVVLESGSKAEMSVRLDGDRLRVNVPGRADANAPPRKFRDRWYSFPSSSANKSR